MALFVKKKKTFFSLELKMLLNIYQGFAFYTQGLDSNQKCIFLLHADQPL